MHVLLIPSWYVTPEFPDSGIFFREKALALHAAGCKMGVLYVEVSPALWRTKLTKGRWWKTQMYTDEGVHTIRTDGLNLPLKWPLGLAIYEQQALSLFKKYVAQHGRPDILHAHSFWSAYIAQRLKEKYGIPFVYTEHLTLIQEGILSQKHIKILQIGAKNADYVTAVSTGLASALRQLIPNQVQVIPNLVNTSFFAPGQRNERFTYLIVGDLIPRKAPLLVMEAFAKLQHTDTKLVFVGEGPLRGEMEQLIRAKQLTDRVVLLGRLSANGVRDALQEASCLLLASKSETFGVVVIEAMSCGLPVIATRSGGPDDIITPQTGILIDPENEHQLITAMDYVYFHPEKYPPEVTREYVINHFGHQKIAEQWIALYQKIVGKS